MFTPHRNGWSSPPPSSGRWKGKAVAITAMEESLPPPPTSTLDANPAPAAAAKGGDDWRSFRDAGFLDEEYLQRREREAHLAKISELESELHKYQYSMGILLIEKKEWCSKYEEMRQGIATAEAILKREQAAHLIAVSELERREENTKKALGIEKHCVADLEKALREMQAELAEAKFTSDKKLSDVHALEASYEEKSIEIEGKLRSADAKLAEASRKNAEINRKLEEIQTREHELQREFISLHNKRKVNEKDISEQKEYLKDWEKKLQEDQKRLADGQRLLNGREEKANDMERILKKKEEELEEEQKRIEVIQKSLKDKEDVTNTRLKDIVSKEKDFDKKVEDIAKREKHLLALEEDLVTKERVELQKLLDDHSATLNAKKKEFETEMEHKRELFTEEVKRELDFVEMEKISIKQKEEHIIKREQAVENKTEKIKMKEKDLETKSKALKKWEDSLKDDEKRLKEEGKQLAEDARDLISSRAGLVRLKAEIEAGNQHITREKENIKLTQEEREQHLILQSKLKQEIDEYMKLKGSLISEREALKHEREKFEREWDALDEKRMSLDAQQQLVNDERTGFEKMRHLEAEKLRSKELELNASIKMELEELRLKEEAFESTMEHERAEAREMLKRERADIARELELRNHELEMNIQKRQEAVEKKLRDRESEFDRRSEVQLNHIKSASNLNESNTRKLKMEQDRLAREKEQMSLHGKKLEADQLEIQKDIDTLRMLSRNLKDQREEFIKERECFLALVEQCKVCKTCGVQISDLQPLRLQPLTEIQDIGNVLLPSLADGFLEEHRESKNAGASPSNVDLQTVDSAGRMSWLKKCSTLFKFSPGKKPEGSADVQVESSSFVARLNEADAEGEANCQPSHSYQIVKDSFHTRRLQPCSGTIQIDVSERIDRDEPEPSIGITDNFVDIMRMHSDNGITGREDNHKIPSASEANEVEGTLPDNDSQASEQRRRQPSRRGRGKVIKRTRTMKEVVEDAKSILGKASDLDDQYQTGDAVGSLNVQEDSLGDSVHTNQVNVRGRQKRRLLYDDGASDLNTEDCEAHSESVSVGNRRKRRNTSTAQAGMTPGEKRYNFRRSTRASSAVAAQAASDHAEGPKAGTHRQPPEDEMVKGDGHTSKDIPKPVPSSDFPGARTETTDMGPSVNVESVFAVQEISSQKLVKVETCMELSDNIEESRENGDEVDGAAGDLPSTPSGRVGHGSQSEDNDDDDDDDGTEDDEYNASIGKKILRFFTS